MTAKWQHSDKQKRRIQNQVSEQYPGVTIDWEDDYENKITHPSIRVPDEMLGEADGIIAASTQTIQDCVGGSVIFHPEKAYDTETGEPAPISL